MSVVLSDFLTTWLVETYRLSYPHVSLLRAYTNEAYLVRTATRRYVLKVYAPNWRTDEAIRWELDLIAHLGDAGVRTPQPVRGVDGHVLQRAPFGRSGRQAVLFPFAPGVKPAPPFSPSMYRREGTSVARLHTALDTYETSHHRPHLDLDHLVWKPVAGIRALFPGHPVLDVLSSAAAGIVAQIEALQQAELDWGPCHGDVTFDNVHLTSRGEFIWYDFDSGGPGWRAIDLQGWAARHPEHDVRFRAFIEGYQSVRPLAPQDIEAAPYVHLAQEIWGIFVVLYRHIAPAGAEAMTAHFTSEIERINARLDQLGGGK